MNIDPNKLIDGYVFNILNFLLSEKSQKVLGLLHPYFVTFAIAFLVLGYIFKLPQKLNREFVLFEATFVMLSFFSGKILSVYLKKHSLPEEAMKVLHHHEIAADILIFLYIPVFIMFFLISKIKSLQKFNDFLYTVVGFIALYLYYTGKNLIFDYKVAAIW